MRHRVYGKRLGRDRNERTLLFKNLVYSLFSYGSISTTEAKAKAIKGLVDKIITLAKNKNTQRLLRSYLNNKDLEERLVKEILPKLGSRNSGFTTMVRLGTRLGDQASIVKMSLIGSEELKPLTKEVKTKKAEQKTEPKLKTTKSVKTSKPKTKTTKAVKGRVK